MFALIESGRAAPRSGEWTSRTLSFAIHAAIVTAAVMATKQVAHDVDPPIVELPNIAWPSPRKPAAPARCVACELPGRPFPPTVPVTLPPPPLTDPPPVTTTFAPGVTGDLVTPGPTPLVPAFRPSSSALPLEARAVDEPPEMLWHPEPRYPEVLRMSGIEGSVVVEAVLDTTGRAEPGTLKIISAAHPLFATEAEQVVLASRYRAGRMSGRAVRVRVRVPISFGLRR